MSQSSIKSLHARPATSSHPDGVVIKELRLLLWFLIGLLLGGYSVLARADYPAEGSWQWPWGGGSFPSVSAVCAADIALPSWSNNYPTHSFQCINVVQPANPVSGTLGSYQVRATSSQNGSYSDTSRTTVYHFTCPSGGTLSGTTCITNPCQVGAASSATWWNGCFDVDGLDNGCDAGSRLPYPTSGVCNGECVVGITNWSSCQMPVGGGPITCTGSGTLTGAQCQPGDNYIPSSSQKCPTGYAIGTVNGVPGCYQTGTPSPATTTTTNTTGSGTTTTTTVKSDPNTNTKTTTTTTTNTTTGDQQTTTTTAPLDPSKPMTGKENKAPGQEPLKIDESGTPTDGSLSAQKADYEAKSNERKSLIDSMANQGNHGLTWDWQFQLPSGGCSAYTFTIAGRSFTLDPCEKLGWVRDALGFLIYITTALALLSIATGQGREGK